MDNFLKLKIYQENENNNIKKTSDIFCRQPDITVISRKRVNKIEKTIIINL